ncbi:hypothetical protein ACOMHN_044733 [Nucella lapillus]
MLSIYPNVHFEPISCLIPSLKINNLVSAGYVCMKPNPKAADTNTRQTPGVQFKEATRRVTQLVTKPCADGSVVQRFHQCQWQGHVLSSQRSPRTFPLFQCQYGPPVHYTLVCDGLPDCVDGSDETGCLFPHLLNKNNGVLICENRQIIPKHRQCDGVADCFDGTDEVLCYMIWALGLFLAAVPFIGQFEFYGESSICLPLPITRHQFSGQIYAFVVFIVLNFLLFLFIGAGQLAIYWAVRRAKAAVKSQRQKEQSSIAQRLFLVVFTDFCCWFPVGVMGILASAGVPVPGEVSVWAAVFVLPLNSTLNPFLYTLNSLKERWRIRKINQKSQRILCNLNGEISKLAPNTVEEMMLISKCFSNILQKMKDEMV